MRQRPVLAVVLGAFMAAMLPGMTMAQDPVPDGPIVFEWTVASDDGGHTGTVDATDPRASGALTLGVGEALVTDAGLLASFSLRLSNDDGTWTGTGRAYGGGEGQDQTVWELTGEGGYEGLSLFTFESTATEGSWGMIVPSDAIPPYPDLPTQ